MSRTSQTLLRLGVPTLAAATMIGGVPALLGSAQAASITTVSIAPLAADNDDSAAAGSCKAYVVSGVNSAAATTVGETVNVILRDLSTSSASNPSFCTLPTGSTTPASGTAVSTGNAQSGGGSVDQSRFVLGANQTGGATTTGQVVIGVTNDVTGAVTPGSGATAAAPGSVVTTPGQVEIRAYSDQNGDNAFTAGEPTATRNVSFTEGGPDGSNANQDAVNALTVLSGPSTAVAGESRTFRVQATNRSGDTVQGANVNFQIAAEAATGTTAAAAAQTGTCGVTDNDGIATCTISLNGAGDGSRDVVFFVNQTDGATTGADASEPQATQTLTVTGAQTASTIAISPQPDVSAAAPYQTDPAVNPRSDGNRTFRVVVDNSATGGTSSVGRQINVTVTGGSGDETVNGTVGNADTTTTTDNTATTGSTTDSFADVVINDPTPVSGEKLTITAVVRGQSTSASSTLSYVAVATDARNIDLAPKVTFTPTGSVTTFTATVIDGNGQPVQGVNVDFTESGPGSFRNGSSTASGTTGRDGKTSVEVTSLQGESGQQTITATMAATAFTTQAAGTPTGNTRAGNTSDTATNNVGIASPTPSASASATPTATTSPTATPTATTSPTASPTATTSPTASPTATQTGTPSPTGTPTSVGTTCTNPAGITLNRSVIFPGTAVRVTVSAPSGADVELQAYSRPNDQFKQVRRSTVATGENSVSFDVTPGTNTRLFADCVGQTRSASAQQVINVRTAISLTVVKNKGLRRNYTFKGTLLPKRAGQLISLYRVTSNGTRVLTSQVKTDSSGVYSFTRQFTGSGTFGFLTRTGQNLTNAFGESNTRPADVVRGNGRPRPTAIF